MTTIWKYKLLITDSQEIEMPSGAKILSVQAQCNEPCIWALVDPARDLETRRFNTYGTGHSIYSDPGEYIGTYQIHDGTLVFHVFEMTKT